VTLAQQMLGKSEDDDCHYYFAGLVLWLGSGLGLWQGSQTHLRMRATLQDITQSVGHVFRDDKMQ